MGCENGALARAGDAGREERLGQEADGARA